MSTTRKTDRRTLYTQSVIKDSLLELLEKESYEKLTVTALCRQAEITRATFYIHYSDLSEVVDAVFEDALGLLQHSSINPSEDMENLQYLLQGKAQVEALKFDTLLPICQRMAIDKKYRILFKDPSLANYIIHKIYLHERETMVPILMESCGLNYTEANLIFQFVIYGAFQVNSSMDWNKSKDWYAIQAKLTTFIVGGFRSLKKVATQHTF